MKLFFTTLLLCCTIAVSAHSSDWQTQDSVRSKAAEQIIENAIIPMALKAYAEGKASVIFNIEQGREDVVMSYIGLSEGKLAEINASFEKIGPKVMAKFTQAVGDFTTQSTTDAASKFEEKIKEIFSSALDEPYLIIKKSLSTEQMARLNELEMALPLPNESIFPNFAAYEELGLSEEQVKNINRIKETYMQEVESNLKETITISPNDELDEKKLLEKVKERKEKMDEFREAQGKRKKTIEEKVDAVLTEKQKELLDTIRARVPEKVIKVFVEEDDSWKRSWKPGDPIPENLKRKIPARRFPVFPVPTQ